MITGDVTWLAVLQNVSNWLSWRGLSPLISQLVSQQQSSISVVLAYSNAVFLHPPDEMQPISTETITAI